MTFKTKLKLLFAAIILLTAGTGTSYAQRKKAAPITDVAVLNQLRLSVESSPDSLSAHKKYIEAMGLQNAELEKQYALWIKKYPKSAVIPFALAKAYLDEESPKAKPFLLKTVTIDPKYTEAWGGLWIDAERWGDFAGGRAYLAKAVSSDPSNPNYNFYYASSFSSVDVEKYRMLSLAVAKRFPAHERGAQALYWLGARSEKLEDKIKYLQLLHDSYNPAKFGWSSSGMNVYFNILLDANPGKAVALAEEMAADKEGSKEWAGFVASAKSVADARKFIADKKAAEALVKLNQVKFPKYFRFNKSLVLLKAEAIALSGNPKAAYDSLMLAFVKNPSPKFQESLLGYGAKLDKDAEAVKGEIYKALDANAKDATPFTLKQYFTTNSTSLSDYKGKVVLLTYWFPGCGPCRGEFPHFEHVVKKFKKEELQYTGINVVSAQNEYVLPFMKTSGYSFTPLEDVDGRVKGNLDNRGAAPTNFLIDQNGKVVFSNFRTDGDNEDELELMINLLLTKNKA